MGNPLNAVDIDALEQEIILSKTHLPMWRLDPDVGLALIQRLREAEDSVVLLDTRNRDLHGQNDQLERVREAAQRYKNARNSKDINDRIWADYIVAEIDAALAAVRITESATELKRDSND